MDEYILVCLYDIKKSIEEVESYFDDYPSMQYEIFVKDFKSRSAVERKVEIMGEAINRILKVKSDFSLKDARDIVNTRNRIIHGYDSVRPEFLWGLVVRHIPELKKEIEHIITEYEKQYNRENNKESDCK